MQFMASKYLSIYSSFIIIFVAFPSCSRPKKCRGESNRYLSHLKSLDSYEDIYDVHLPSNVVEDSGYNYNFKDNEYLPSDDSKSKQIFSADVNYVNYSPSSPYFSTEDNYQSSLETIAGNHEDLADNEKVYEKKLVYVDAEPNENIESEQILPSNKNEFIDSSGNSLSTDRIKKWRINYENLKINSPKQSNKNRLRKLRNKGRKRRKQKSKNDMEMKYEFSVISDQAHPSLPKEVSSVDEKQIIQLGEKPSDKFPAPQEQEEDDEEGEESGMEGTKYAKNEPISAKNITADMISGQLESTSKANFSKSAESLYSTEYSSNTITGIGNMKNETDMADTSQLISNNNHSNNKELRLESKISEIIPRTVQKYLEKIKSWNNKRGNKQNSKPFRSKLKYHHEPENDTTTQVSSLPLIIKPSSQMY